MAGSRKISAVAKYISRKVSALSWEPVSSGGVLQSPIVFATGSYDDDENRLSLWSAMEDDANESTANEDDYYQPVYSEAEPEFLCTIQHRGDVTKLLFLSSDVIIVSSSSGGVTLYRFDRDARSLTEEKSWPRLHILPGYSSCSCTSIAHQTNEFVSVGQDGRLNVVNLDRTDQVHPAGLADGCSLSDVCYIQQRCVAVVNSIGQFKVWDLRQNMDRPSKVLVLSGDRVPLHCMAQHPTQPHILTTGGQDGMLYIWDMRQESRPITILKAHESDMWDVKFHATNPDHLFTCSSDGSLWHWDNSKAQSDSMGLLGKGLDRNQRMESSDWMTTSPRYLDIKDLLNGANTLSVNCLDTTGTKVVCGTDNEQIILISHLNIF